MLLSSFSYRIFPCFSYSGNFPIFYQVGSFRYRSGIASRLHIDSCLVIFSNGIDSVLLHFLPFLFVILLAGRLLRRIGNPTTFQYHFRNPRLPFRFRLFGSPARRVLLSKILALRLILQGVLSFQTHSFYFPIPIM